MCLVVVINVRDEYNFPYRKKIPSLSPNLRTEQRNPRHLGCILQRSHSVCNWSDESQKSTCYNVGAILDSILSEPCERKTLVMAEKSQNLCHIFSNEESSAKMNLIKKAQQWKLLMKI